MKHVVETARRASTMLGKIIESERTYSSTAVSGQAHWISKV